MKTSAANLLLFLVLLCESGLGQVAYDPGVMAPQSGPYQTRPPAVPQAPDSPQPAPGWANQRQSDLPLPNGPLTPEQDSPMWLMPPGGIPEKFVGTEVVARIGSEVVLASELMPGVEETIQRALEAGQLRNDQVPMARHTLMYQKLQNLIDTKMLVVEAHRVIPKDNFPKIEKKVREVYEKKEMPAMIDGKKIKSRAELIEAMHKAGTSLEDQQRQFMERALAAEMVRQKVGEQKEITHEEMLAYYRKHLADYETAPRARWEHVMVRASNYPSKEEAYAKIAAWGNDIFKGVPLAEVAKQHSDDPSNETGGLHDWTVQGSLLSDVIDRAIFALPVNKLSPILEDDRGFHIIRVVERHGLIRKPFPEVQAEIKKKITAERSGVAGKEFIAELRKRVPVWTIFDELAKKEQTKTQDSTQLR